jgi:hypothetical protein
VQTDGGVYFAIRNDIAVQEMPELESQCIDLWVKLDLVGNKSLVIGRYYKIEELDPESFLEFWKSLEKEKKVFGT